MRFPVVILLVATSLCFAFVEKMDSPSVVALSEDGRFLAVGTSDSRIWVFDLGKMILLRRFEVSSKVTALTFTGGGKYIVSGESDGTFDILNVETGGVIQSVKVNPSPVIKVFSLKGGRYIAVARYDGSIEIWDSSGWWKFVDINSALSDPSDVEVTDRYAVVSKGRVVKIWSLVSSKLINTVPLDFDVNDVEITMGGRTLIVSGVDDKGSTKVLAMSLLTGMDVEDLSFLEGVSRGLRDMKASPDGVILVGVGFDGVVRVWDLDSFELLGSFDVGNPDGLAFTKDAMTIASFRKDWNVKVWKVKGNWVGKVLEDFHADVSDIDYVPGIDGILVSGYNFLGIYGSDGKKIFKVKVRGYVTSVDMDLDDNLIAAGYVDGEIKLWNSRGNFLALVGESDSRIIDVSISKGKVLSFSKFGRLSVWDIEERYEVEGRNLEYDVTSAKFSNDGDNLVIGTLEGDLILYDVSKKTPVWKVKAFENPVFAVSISKGYIVAGDSEGNVQLRSRKDGELVISVKGKLGSISAVSVDEKSGVFICADRKGNVEVWDFKGRIVDKFEMGGAVLDVAIGNGDYFMGGWSGRLVRWMRTNLKFEVLIVPGGDYAIFEPRGKCVVSENFENSIKSFYHLGPSLKNCEVRR